MGRKRHIALSLPGFERSLFVPAGSHPDSNRAIASFTIEAPPATASGAPPLPLMRSLAGKADGAFTLLATNVIVIIPRLCGYDGLSTRSAVALSDHCVDKLTLLLPNVCV